MSDFKRKFISPGLPDQEKLPQFPKGTGFISDCPKCGKREMIATSSEGTSGGKGRDCESCGQVLRATCCECGGLGGVPNPDVCGCGPASSGSDLMACYHCGTSGMSSRDCCTGFTPEPKGENQ